MTAHAFALACDMHPLVAAFVLHFGACDATAAEWLATWLAVYSP